MALTITFLIIFGFILLVFNYKNKYSLLFALISFSIALCAIALIVEIHRSSNYNMTRTYFFSWVDTYLFFRFSRYLSPLATPLALQNIGYVLFQTANLACLFLFGKYKKHSAQKGRRLKWILVGMQTVFILLYLVFYHSSVGYRIFLAQHTADAITGGFILSVSKGLYLLLTFFTWLNPLIPVLYLIYHYRKGNLTLFFEQLLGLVLSLLAMDLLFFVFVSEPLFVRWNELLQTGFWRGLSANLIPKYNLGILPLISLGMLLAAFLLVRFQTMNFIEYFKEYSVKKNLRILHDNLRDVLHSEKNVIFNLKILAEGAIHDYGTPQGKQKLERLVGMSSSHLESLTQSINNIKEARIKTIKRDFKDAIDAALRAYPLPREIKLVKNYHSEAVFCSYDLYHVTQVIINLLENAVDSLKDRAGAGIELSLDVSDYWVVFSVSDNGSGVPRKVIKKICKPYFSTKSKQNNWGIGLSYVQRVVKAHFGYMRIQSRPNEWTKVELLFMCAQVSENQRV